MQKTCGEYYLQRELVQIDKLLEGCFDQPLAMRRSTVQMIYPYFTCIVKERRGRSWEPSGRIEWLRLPKVANPRSFQAMVLTARALPTTLAIQSV